MEERRGAKESNTVGVKKQKAIISLSKIQREPREHDILGKAGCCGYEPVPRRFDDAQATESLERAMGLQEGDPGAAPATATLTAYELLLAAGIKEEGLVPDEALDVLEGLARNLSDIEHAHMFRLQPLKGAMTNQVFECRWRRDHVGKRPKKVLVRVYGAGSNLFFNREDEVATFEYMSARRQGPLLLARFPNGRVEEFLYARTLTAEDLRDARVSARIAAKLSEFHSLDIPRPKVPVLWDRLRSWLQLAVELATERQIQEFKLRSLGPEIDALKLRLSKLPGPVGFCHNDLQYGNIMMNEEEESVTIIDYEYSGYNPVAFDIANHFCEMAANYHTDTPHRLDFSKYPDFEERCRFVRHYLQACQDPGAAVSDSEVETFTADTELYCLVSHLQWGLWGIISASKSDICFDFEEYARQRLSRYFELKGKVLEGDVRSDEDLALEFRSMGTASLDDGGCLSVTP